MENEVMQIRSALEKMDKDKEFVITIPLTDGKEADDDREKVQT